MCIDHLQYAQHTQIPSLLRALLPFATVPSVPPAQSYNISLTHMCAHTPVYSHTTASYTQLHTHTYIQSHTLTCSHHINIHLYTHRWHTHIQILSPTFKQCLRELTDNKRPSLINRISSKYKTKHDLNSEVFGDCFPNSSI